MLKGHPKGLLVAFFANMGERFGFYTMMACLVFYLQAKYNMNATAAGDVYSWFYFGIYGAALIGGLIADGTRNYKGTILFGIVTMLGGYVFMTVPGLALPFTIAGLSVIALGNGLFKGNLQAIVGQMYDDPKYEKLRDSAFSVFYMGINMGALVAPFAANGIRNWYLKSQGFAYNADLQSYAAKFNTGELPIINTLEYTGADKIFVGESVPGFAQRASEMMANANVSSLTEFVKHYLEAFATGYNYAFGIAAFSMVISMVIFVFFKKMLPDKKSQIAEAEAASGGGQNKTEAIGKSSLVKILVSLGIMAGTAVVFHFLLDKFSLGMAIGLFFAFVSWIYLSSTKEERPRLNALLLVFMVVIFFWMSFHQNGLTLSMFARDYTANSVEPITNMLFTLPSLLCIFAFILGLVQVVKRNNKSTSRLFGAVAMIAGAGVGYYLYSRFDALNAIEPEIFQSFNPIFIVFLTPVILALFTWLRNRNIEPSTPRKIGIGMILAGLGFVVMIFSSFGLDSPLTLAGTPSPDRVSVYWLINTYLVLTIAELFLSPMGISFVSKVSPSRFQGLMQGGWLLATAVGNKLLFVGSTLWEKIELWQLWAIFVMCCLVSAAFVFSIMKRLERATK
ncbi:MAG: peptide MFS transporter [Bacteroidales bacterium]|nr:peptide MFS transporter [Bacteroidales bacterium]MCF8403057.1 peptide MFS transporter [Bacteroidales bacterium]